MKTAYRALTNVEAINENLTRGHKVKVIGYLRIPYEVVKAEPKLNLVRCINSDGKSVTVHGDDIIKIITECKR